MAAAEDSQQDWSRHSSGNSAREPLTLDMSAWNIAGAPRSKLGPAAISAIAGLAGPVESVGVAELADIAEGIGFVVPELVALEDIAPAGQAGIPGRPAERIGIAGHSGLVECSGPGSAVRSGRLERSGRAGSFAPAAGSPGIEA
jgi:hypothetical protein